MTKKKTGSKMTHAVKILKLNTTTFLRLEQDPLIIYDYGVIKIDRLRGGV